MFQSIILITLFILVAILLITLKVYKGLLRKSIELTERATKNAESLGEMSQKYRMEKFILKEELETVTNLLGEAGYSYERNEIPKYKLVKKTK